ncbi:MAG: transglycosylase SLT domain-containing protein [Betaproteobacteria bacterium]|nr:transglycosylase SLT domain-containing protein [Betaproteobacteria bacterium]
MRRLGIVLLAHFLVTCAQASDTTPPATMPQSLAESRPAQENPTIPQTLLPDEGITDQELIQEDPTESLDQVAPDDLWDRLRSGFSLPPLSTTNLLVAHHIDWLANRPDYVERTLNRSRPYLYFIVHEVQRRGMPTEIALLPFVESAFNPHAISRSQASGMWQFIPSTAKIFGLHQNWWYDGRKDIVSTTNSALDYLQQLHDEFQDWNLALASYNAGEGKVRRALAYNRAHGQPTDLEHLDLPEETRNYVPRLMAAKAIVLAPEHYGLILPPIPDEPYFVAITTHKTLDTRVAADFCQLSESEFLMLNPGFNRPLIPFVEHQEQTILVPVAVAQSFSDHLNDPQAQLVSWEARQLKRGDSFSRIAHQYGMTEEHLKKVNGIPETRKIAGGGMILVPATRETGNTPTPSTSVPLNGKPESDVAAPVKASVLHTQHGHHHPHSSHVKTTSRHSASNGTTQTHPSKSHHKITRSKSVQ